MKTPALILAGLILGTLTTGPAQAAHSAPAHPNLPHVACTQEDSVSCTWDAVHLGNSLGESYWVGKRGIVHRISHRTAHRLIFG